MYALTAEQLKTLQNIVVLAEAMPFDGNLVVSITVTDTDNDVEIGRVSYDENGIVGFIPEA